ncbi:HAMP domain-containing sensor histidine kinase [Congregibacter variabilis]|uniref:histidine kinase n=1 Tax=Congregibacter variabilis TaxID=3081200 RepID=A0ABZ0IAL5_9GAMM|nr:HAMP domain-containing sensor histidine kinase [Congregibacter sp. IMCC43200]
MTKRSSIERQVTRSFVGLTLLLTSVYLGFVLLIAYVTEDEIIDRLLNSEINYLQDSYRASGRWPTPRLDYFALYHGVEEAPQPVRRQLLKNPQSQEIFTPDDSHYHARYLQLSDEHEALLVAEVSPLLAVTNFSSGLFQLLGGLTAATLALSLWLAYRIARKTSRPIMQLSDEVKEVRNSQKSLTLSAAGQDDEIGYLADTIQNSFQQLSDAIDRESNFTRDVSHELRTPLTVIKNSLLLLENRQSEAQDIEQLRNAAEHMQSTVSILLALARQESVPMQRLRLRPIVEETILSLDRALSETGFAIELAIPDDYELMANPQLISLLTGNLIENALRYANEPRMDIALRDDCLVFSNPTNAPPINNPLKANSKQPDSPGLGQGLFLVERIAARLNWQAASHWDSHRFDLILRISP